MCGGQDKSVPSPKGEACHVQNPIDWFFLFLTSQLIMMNCLLNLMNSKAVKNDNTELFDFNK